MTLQKKRWKALPARVTTRAIAPTYPYPGFYFGHKRGKKKTGSDMQYCECDVKELNPDEEMIEIKSGPDKLRGLHPQSAEFHNIV